MSTAEVSRQVTVLTNKKDVLQIKLPEKLPDGFREIIRQVTPLNFCGGKAGILADIFRQTAERLSLKYLWWRVAGG